MRIVAISDIHGCWGDLPSPPDGDVLIIAGDFLGNGNFGELQRFVLWVQGLRFSHKICIAGNHDLVLEEPGAADIMVGMHYLQDAGVTIDGVRFWGSPWTPMYGNWAFMADDRLLANRWALIPADTDVLVTHGPPLGILDRVERRKGYGLCVGSQTLRDARKTLGIGLHIVGHIHEHGGITHFDGRTLTANVAAFTHKYKIRPYPWTVLEFERG